ncbi:hypothetical protein [Sphingobacterium sp.]|uniref:hypothetical protein n=1 Tax=Sphingobacterium sp. TaxID=341027 RepID=UPI002897BDFE|nr:hypothetical protein [Sphingobacterium sp.]
MSSIINRFWGKKSVRNEESLILANRLSFKNSQLNGFLIKNFLETEKATKQGYIDFQALLLQLTTDRFESLHVELDLLNRYLLLVESFMPQGFLVKFENKIKLQYDVLLPPLILFPMVQHAVENGYNTMSSHPIRIRLSGSSKLIVLEVSYRVNHYLEGQFKSDLIRDFEKRLDYLFPEKHNLLMNSNSNTCRSTLTIQL